MKRIIVTILLSLISFWGFSQNEAIKMKLYYWNNSEQNFNNVLTTNGKILLDSVLSVSKIDLSKCDRVEKKDIIRYMDSKYLSTQKYQYVYYSNSGGKLNKEVYQNFSGPIVGDKRKVVLYHSSGKNVDDITLFVIY